MSRLVCSLFLLPLFLLPSFALTAPAQGAEFELLDGDRVVLLGDALIEQEQYAGWIETALTAAYPNRHVTFRNLGWNADTPAGASRLGLSLVQAGQESPEEGWRQLQAQLELTKPTLLVIGYGMASALESGDAGVDRFAADYQRLLDAAKQISPDVRFVMLSPLQARDAEPALAATLKRYHQAIETVAQANDGCFVDMTSVGREASDRKDAIHLTDAGYRDAAIQLTKSLKDPQTDWQTSPRTGALRENILRKNVWWFHRSRPANMAYVFGFRKREQGQNAVEIPKFDALIEGEEQRIAALRGLQAVELPAREPQIESQYAEFTAQPTPEFTVADGWEVRLWAENPQLNKPIHMNFDPQGRLWVASSEAYPMIEVGQSAPDKILVLEDTNGDGTADKSTTFADGLLIPTGVAPGDGGVYVAQSTDLLFLKDTDGDGQADQQTRVLSGFGTEDTHHNLHTLQWGPDGRLYMNQSVYTRTDTETPHGVVRLRAGGGFRLDTQTLQMQVVFQGLWNAWGHQFDAYGQSFLTDGAGFKGIAWSFPGAVFFPTPRARRQLDLISPGNYPKFASAEIIYGDSFPPEWQGSLVTCDFRANRVTRFSLADQEAGFVTTQEADLLRTSASTFRPIDVKQGPDGALYIADWSNPIINHGEVDFRDPRRDRWHGRIWRLQWTGKSKSDKVDLLTKSNTELLDNLLSNDRFIRDKSRRVLLERPLEPAELTAWTQAHTEPMARLQSLWLHQGLDLVNVDLLNQLLTTEQPEIAAAAVRVLADWSDPRNISITSLPYSAAEKHFREAVHHSHPRVRLEAVRGLSKIGTAAAVELALASRTLPRDRFLDFAAAKLVDDHAEVVTDAIQAGTWTTELAFVLTSIEPQQAERCLATYLSQHAIDREGSGPWIELIGQAGGADLLGQLFQQAIAGAYDDAATARALTALGEAQRLRKRRPTGGLGALGKLIASSNPEVQRAAIELAGSWKMGGQVPAISAVATSDSADVAQRSAAIVALRQIGGGPALQTLKGLAANAPSGPLTANVLGALAVLDVNRAVKPLYAALAKADDEAQAAALWRAVLQSQGAGKVLAAAVPAEGLPELALQAGLRVTRDGGRNEPELAKALTDLVGKTMQATKLTPQRVAELVQAVQQTGDPHRGEAIYWREKLQCVSCHAIGGVGGRVGPDMTSLGASAPIDYIIESLYEPNAKIKENYHSVVVATDDGQVLTGIEVENTGEELVLRNATNQLIRIPTAEVVAKKNGPSLMPAGVIDRLTPAEQVDLIRFITELGKPGAFDAGSGGVARVVEVFAGTHRVEQAGVERITSGQPIDGGKRLLTRVNGAIPKAMLVEATKQPFNISLVNLYLRTRVSVSNDGQAKLTVSGPEGFAAWIDGQAVEVDAKTKSFGKQLAAGEHTVVIRIDARDVPEAITLRSQTVTFALE